MNVTMEIYSFRCPKKLWDEVKAKAESTGLSVSDILRIAMYHYTGDCDMNNLLSSKESIKTIYHTPDEARP
jgi:hypothetical protein